MSAAISLNSAYDAMRVKGDAVNALRPVNSITAPKDLLYEPTNSMYIGRDKAMPLAVQDYLVQVKSYSDALSTSLSSLMRNAPDTAEAARREEARRRSEEEAARRSEEEKARLQAAADAQKRAEEDARRQADDTDINAAADDERMREEEDEAQRLAAWEAREDAWRIREDTADVADENRRGVTTTAQVGESLETLVDNYNALLAFSADYDKDPGFARLNHRLTALSETYSRDLNDAGIDVQPDGALALDDERAARAIADGRVARLFTDDERGVSFARGLGTAAERGVSEPFAYMDADAPRRPGESGSGRAYMRMIDTHNAQGLMFEAAQ